MTVRVVNITKNPIHVAVGGHDLLFQPSDGNPRNPKPVKGVWAMKTVTVPHRWSSQSDESHRVELAYEKKVTKKRMPVEIDKDAKSVPWLDVSDEIAKALFEGKKVECHQGLGPEDPETGEKLNGLMKLNAIEGAATSRLADLEKQNSDAAREANALKAEKIALQQEVEALRATVAAGQAGKTIPAASAKTGGQKSAK